MTQTITVRPDTSRIKGLVNPLQLEAILDAEPMVACTPCYEGVPVLPTKETPYAPQMRWTWDINHDVTVNGTIIVAKTTHRFWLETMAMRPDDELELVLSSKHLKYRHG